MYEELYKELADILKKFKYSPATGNGNTRMELEVDAQWVRGEILMVEVNTKNRNPGASRITGK